MSAEGKLESFGKVVRSIQAPKGVTSNFLRRQSKWRSQMRRFGLWHGHASPEHPKVCTPKNISRSGHIVLPVRKTSHHLSSAYIRCKSFASRLTACISQCRGIGERPVHLIEAFSFDNASSQVIFTNGCSRKSILDGFAGDVERCRSSKSSEIPRPGDHHGPRSTHVFFVRLLSLALFAVLQSHNSLPRRLRHQSYPQSHKRLGKTDRSRSSRNKHMLPTASMSCWLERASLTASAKCAQSHSKCEFPSLRAWLWYQMLALDWCSRPREKLRAYCTPLRNW
ncbi:hypothetical protein HDK90DRAFT_250042 [Phyllosticta capitalensis]|uniref:Uncharacterized protein n=1 Tax=Phyllosticta capitalensis TaxID=121624 RepID=A0ABR1YQ50_9PEZI